MACSSCHGPAGGGVAGRGPKLAGVGAASAYLWVSSGRMPWVEGEGSQSLRKPSPYTARQIDDLVAFVASLAPGPGIPAVEPSGDLGRGQQLYAANCAGCHNSAGSGGALGQGIWAPSLRQATVRQQAAAVRIGPGAMPAFGPRTLPDADLAAILAYIGHLQRPDDPGGSPLGRLGPVPEGMVAWIVGVGLLTVAARLIGTRSRT